jgi:EAL domain-containing protein (putative c-di-GMP-specific phosphodiesterase class I)
MRWSAAFIATCMVVIAASLAATAYLVLGFTGVEAIATALTVLAVLAAYNLFSSRGREDASLSDGAERAAPDPAAQRDHAVGGPFHGLARDEIVGLIRGALTANRVDLYLQPIVTLPQRKVRHYEVLMRLRTEDGAIVTPSDFLGYARDGGLMPLLDNAMLLRATQVVRRLAAKNSEIGLFCNIAAATLADTAVFAQVADFLAANRPFASFLTFQLTQDARRALGPSEQANLMQLASLGFRFSMDRVGDLAIEPRALADQGFRFAKVPAALMLHHAGAAVGDIHPADLCNLLARYGIDVIADRIESEGTVVDLLNYDVRFGQGLLFGAPRPVRADVFQGAPERPPQARVEDAPIPAEAKPVAIASGAPARRREPAEPAGQAAVRTPSGLTRLARDMVRRA